LSHEAQEHLIQEFEELRSEIVVEGTWQQRNQRGIDHVRDIV